MRALAQPHLCCSSSFPPTYCRLPIASERAGFVTMAGPNLELFKFGMYLFFPLAVMVHYGDPEWYHRNVLPVSCRPRLLSAIRAYMLTFA